jgi:hypothetical protein
MSHMLLSTASRKCLLPFHSLLNVTKDFVFTLSAFIAFYFICLSSGRSWIVSVRYQELFALLSPFSLSPFQIYPDTRYPLYIIT